MTMSSANVVVVKETCVLSAIRLPRLDAVCWTSEEHDCLRVLWHVVARLDCIRNAFDFHLVSNEFHLVSNAPAVGTAGAIMGGRALRGQFFFFFQGNEEE